MSDTRYRYGIIGTGIPGHVEGATGFGMAHYHWPGFRRTERVDLVAIADIVPANAQLFLEKQECDAKIYTDYHAMLAQENLDIVSITVWPHLHAEMTIAAAEAGVKAIHCEKPMAITWGDCQRMKAAADANGAKLTFNHQRRHMVLFQTVRQLIREGAIGDLVLVEAECGDMYDWGTHWLDMMFFYNEDTPAEWVLGQIESQTGRTAFGAMMEDQAVCHFKWKNGVRGQMITGPDTTIGATHRLIGTEGMLEVTPHDWKIRLRGKGDAEWRYVETQQGPINDFHLACADVVRQLDEPGYQSILSVNNVIQHTEVIFATYYSSLLRGRVDLPMAYEGNALLKMVEAGQIGPKLS